MSRAPLTPEQDDALRTLETTRDYAAGEAAIIVLKGVRRPIADGVDVALAALTALFLAFIGQGLDAIAAPAIARLPITLAGLAALFAAFALRRARNDAGDRVKSAINRWRQIAGTLAVQARTETPS